MTVLLRQRFLQNGADDVEIINKEAKIETSDLGDGYKKAVVTVKFSPNTAKITDLTIGTVGVSTAFWEAYIWII